MSKNSKTLVQIEDLTDTQVGVDPDGVLHVLIGADDEHQVELVCSIRTGCGLAASIVDAVPDRVEVLQHELAKWITEG